MRPLRVYVAGPLSKLNDDGTPYRDEQGRACTDPAALERADKAAQKLFMLGFHPYCPHSHTHEWCKNPAPEFHDYKRVVEEFDGDFLLNFCDCLLLLPGWSSSKGSLLEKQMAEQAGLPIFIRIADLLNWRSEVAQSDLQLDSAVEEGALRHGHPRFYEILGELADLHDRKNHDYAGDGDPLRNLRMCEEYGGLAGWKGVVIRLTDKLSRLLAFMRQGELRVKDESVEDTFRDTAVYSILGLILFEDWSRARTSKQAVALARASKESNDQ